MKELAPALFLDRDGVVNREVGYLSNFRELEFIPGIFELTRKAQAMGYKLIIVTNQAGIARNLYTEEEFHGLMHWMTAHFASALVQLDGYYYCPHHPEHGIGKYRVDCPERKPQPGMFLRASHEHGIDLAESLLIGDRCSDIRAGASAGVGKLVLLEGTEDSAGCGSELSYSVVATLAAAESFLGRSIPVGRSAALDPC